MSSFVSRLISQLVGRWDRTSQSHKAAAVSAPASSLLPRRAAMALLSGDSKAPTDELLGALGLTDFSLRQTEGTVRETVVSLGKQLSRRWYVGYERSVNATTGTWASSCTSVMTGPTTVVRSSGSPTVRCLAAWVRPATSWS